MMYRWNLRLLLSATLLLLSSLGVHSLRVCTSEWERLVGTETKQGTETNTLNLQDCLQICEYNPMCLAVDFSSSSVKPCRLQTDSAYKTAAVPNPSSSQYRLSRRCLEVDDAALKCPSTWMMMPEKKFTFNGAVTTHATLASCFNHCRFNPLCYSIVFNAKSWPPCHLYGKNTTSLSFTADEDSSFYAFNDKDTCSGSLSYGRCVNQAFPATNKWCADGQKPKATKKSFKNHPLCCGGQFDSTPPLDSPNIPEFLVDNMDAEYGKAIDNCLADANCSFAAKSFTKNYISNAFCDDKTSTGFVSVTYECLVDGASPKPPFFTPTPIPTQASISNLITLPPETMSTTSKNLLNSSSIPDMNVSNNTLTTLPSNNNNTNPFFTNFPIVPIYTTLPFNNSNINNNNTIISPVTTLSPTNNNTFFIVTTLNRNNNNSITTFSPQLVTNSSLSQSSSSSSSLNTTATTMNFNFSLFTPPPPITFSPLTLSPNPISTSSSSPSSNVSQSIFPIPITTPNPPSNQSTPTFRFFPTQLVSFTPTNSPPIIPPSTILPTSFPQTITQGATTTTTTTTTPPIGELKNASSNAYSGLVLGAIGTALGILCLLILIGILVLVIYNTKKQNGDVGNSDLTGKSHVPNNNYMGMSVV